MALPEEQTLSPTTLPLSTLLSVTGLRSDGALQWIGDNYLEKIKDHKARRELLMGSVIVLQSEHPQRAGDIINLILKLDGDFLKDVQEMRDNKVKSAEVKWFLSDSGTTTPKSGTPTVVSVDDIINGFESFGKLLEGDTKDINEEQDKVQRTNKKERERLEKENGALMDTIKTLEQGARGDRETITKLNEKLLKLNEKLKRQRGNKVRKQSASSSTKSPREPRSEVTSLETTEEIFEADERDKDSKHTITPNNTTTLSEENVHGTNQGHEGISEGEADPGVGVRTPVEVGSEVVSSGSPKISGEDSDNELTKCKLEYAKMMREQMRLVETLNQEIFWLKEDAKEREQKHQTQIKYFENRIEELSNTHKHEATLSSVGLNLVTAKNSETKSSVEEQKGKNNKKHETNQVQLIPTKSEINESNSVSSPNEELFNSLIEKYHQVITKRLETVQDNASDCSGDGGNNVNQNDIEEIKWRLILDIAKAVDCNSPSILLSEAENHEMKVRLLISKLKAIHMIFFDLQLNIKKSTSIEPPEITLLGDNLEKKDVSDTSDVVEMRNLLNFLVEKLMTQFPKIDETGRLLVALERTKCTSEAKDRLQDRYPSYTKYYYDILNEKKVEKLVERSMELLKTGACDTVLAFASGNILKMKPKQQVEVYELVISICFSFLKRFGFKEVIVQDSLIDRK